MCSTLSRRFATLKRFPNGGWEGLLSPQVAAMVDMIREALPGAGSIDAAVSAVRTRLALFGSSAANEQDLQAAKSALESEYNIEILRKSSVVALRPIWYHGPQPQSIHWPALRSYLLGYKKMPGGSVDSIDQFSSEIVSLLDDPSLSQYSCRGLVVGYVQSGKTANMTAVIAKAVDSGYNVIVVLAGLTDKLRQQTQRRLEADLVNRHKEEWIRLTRDDIKGEFQIPAQKGLPFVNRTQIAVMKKNVAPLQRFRDVIKETLTSDLRKMRFLIIDDECDQGSINSAADELNITKINKKIRQLLKEIPAVSYVGYTATPFANVLINPYAGRSGTLDDLYPKDFITALPLPSGYFGTQSMFGLPPFDAESPEDDGLDIVRDISDVDEALLQPKTRKDQVGFVPKMASSLEKAIVYYLATCAARRARGQQDEHMTMLVHTSSFIRMHESVAAIVEDWLATHTSDLASLRGEKFDLLQATWHEELGKVPEELVTGAAVEFSDVSHHLPEVLAHLEVVVENGASDDRVEYAGPPKTYIVVGGSILARGLTLEGLCVSYFLRTSNQYDTLLQMGRWFGYRGGYEDLPRLWMPPALQTRFRSLASIEAEIREDIYSYSRSPSITPMEFAVRVRAIPGMAITARDKMRHAIRCGVGYWGRHVQTIRFQRTDEKTLKENWQAGALLVTQAQDYASNAGATDRLLFEGVPRKHVIRFLKAYRVDPSHQDLADKLLLAFVEQNDPTLEHWNIGIVTAADGKLAGQPLGALGQIAMVNRSRLERTEDKTADIKALMSKSDVVFDCPPDQVDFNQDWEKLKERRRALKGEVPLLLLYAIDKQSTPKRNGSGKSLRRDLDAAYDVLAFGMVLPKTRDFAGNYVSVQLKSLSEDELNAIEAEELEASGAAGV